MRAALSLLAITMTLALAGTLAGGQQVKRTETGTVTAGLIEYDFGHNVFTATGNARVTILGKHNSELRAPRLSMNVNQKVNQILAIDATGPVNFEVLTAPDDQGLRRRIVGHSNGGGTYRQSTQTAVLSGGAVADVITLPEGNAEAAHFEGESIVIDLNASTLSVRQATIEVTTEVSEGGN